MPMTDNTSARIVDADFSPGAMKISRGDPSNAGTSNTTSANTDPRARLGRLHGSPLQAAQGYQRANASQMAQANQSSQGILNLFE